MSRTLQAFIVAPLVAASVNALVMAFQLPDAAGSPVIAWRLVLFTVLGLPFAFGATTLLGLPMYVLLRRITEPTLVMVLAAGALIAAIVTGVFASTTGSWSSLPLERTLPIGLIAASAWWWVATRGKNRGQFRDRELANR